MTNTAVVAGSATFVHASEHGGTADGHDAIVEISRQGIAKILFDAGHLHRRKKLAVGKLRQSFGLSADSGEFLHVVIPRRNIRVTNRPIAGDTFLGVGFEVKIAPAIGLASPGDGLSADLAPFDPGKMFSRFAGVRIVGVFDEKLIRKFVARVITLALDRLSGLAFLAVIPIAILEFPDRNVFHVIFFRSDGPAGFENERVQTLLGKLLRGPASRNSRTDDDRVISWCRHFLSERSGFPETGAQGLAAMLRAWDNLQFEFLGKTNFRSVVTVDGNAFEDLPEFAFHLLVGRLHMVSMMSVSNAAGECGIVNGAQLCELLFGSSIDKILAEKSLALFINFRKTFEEMSALLRSSPFGEDNVDKFVDPRAFGAGRVGRRNNLFGHSYDGVILVRCERAQGVPRRRLRLAKQREQLRRDYGEHRSRGKNA